MNGDMDLSQILWSLVINAHCFVVAMLWKKISRLVWYDGGFKVQTIGFHRDKLFIQIDRTPGYSRSELIS